MLSAALLQGQAPRLLWDISTALQMPRMRTIGEIRRENLELLIEEAGTLDAVAEKGETHQVYLSQIRNRASDAKTGRPRELGTVVARRLETKFGKDRGWMDEPHYPSPRPARRHATGPGHAEVGPLSARETDAVLALRAVSQKIRDRVVNELMQAAEDANHFAAEVLARQGARISKAGDSLPVRPDGPQLDSLPGELDEHSPQKR